MIQAAVESGVKAIARVHVASWRETYPGIMPPEILDGPREEQRADQWRRWFLPERGLREALTVCEDAGKVVGFASAAIPPESREVELLTLYLRRRIQGRSFGRQLMTDIATRMQQRGATSLICWMAVGDPTAGFYEHMGGIVVDTKIQPFGSASVEEVQYRWPGIPGSAEEAVPANGWRRSVCGGAVDGLASRQGESGS